MAVVLLAVFALPVALLGGGFGALGVEIPSLPEGRLGRGGARLDALVFAMLAALLMLAVLAFGCSRLLRIGACVAVCRVCVAMVLYGSVPSAALVLAGQGSWLADRAAPMFQGVLFAALIVLLAKLVALGCLEPALSRLVRRVAFGMLLFALGATLTPTVFLPVLSALMTLTLLAMLLIFVCAALVQRLRLGMLTALMAMPLVLAAGYDAFQYASPDAAAGASPWPLLGAVLLLAVYGFFCFLWMDRRAANERRRQTDEQLAWLAAEQERAGQALEAAQVRIDALEKTRLAFLSAVNHELRAPLATIAGMCAMLREEPDCGPLLQRDFLSMERCAHCLLQLLDEAIAFEGGVAAAPQRLEPGPVYVPAFAEALRDDGDWLAGRFRGYFDIRLAAGLPDAVLTDVGRVRQIIWLLLLNAWQHANGSYVRLKISVAGGDGLRRLRFTVLDNGRGISPSLYGNILLPYCRSRTSTGLGLGLALCVRLANELKGSLRAGRSGRGGAFRLEVPLIEPVPNPDSTPRFAMKLPKPRARRTYGLSLNRLSASDGQALGLDRLGVFVQTGRLSEIEDWVNTSRKLTGLSESARVFVGAVEAAAARLDLYGLERLLGSDSADTVATGEGP